MTVENSPCTRIHSCLLSVSLLRNVETTRHCFPLELRLNTRVIIVLVATANGGCLSWRCNTRIIIVLVATAIGGYLFRWCSTRIIIVLATTASGGYLPCVTVHLARDDSFLSGAARTLSRRYLLMDSGVSLEEIYHHREMTQSWKLVHLIIVFVNNWSVYSIFFLKKIYFKNYCFSVRLSS